jgi:hypothetical protein
MRPQTRPFTVETKKGRRALQPAQPNWSHVIDEPSPEELPSRHIREDTSPPEGGADPLAAANGMFSALARNAISTAASLGGLAASVFTPARSEDPSEEAAPVSPPANQDAPARRVLPSLLPINRFEPSHEEVPTSVKAKPAVKKPRRSPSKVVKARRSPDEVPSVSENAGSDLVTQQTLAPEPKAESRRVNRKPKWGRAEARVRPGERWKRRLPKACR